jgi:monofunctional biosynthetic peptidoglycan transglycosylase
MEVYLNSIEMGNGIYGAEAAAQYWFKRPAANLRQQEAAAIAAILPSPLRYRANPATNFIQGRKNWITRQMHFFGPLNYD